MIIPYNRTKIVATLGPASSSEEVLEGLIRAGVDVARLNLSHGNHEDHKAVISRIRSLRKKLGHNICILADMQGPKIRIGDLEHPLKVGVGDVLYFDSKIEKQAGNLLPIQYETFAKDVNEGDMVLVDDGKIQLTVLETDKKHRVKLRVDYEGEIKQRKGVNLPFTAISLPSITEKDESDIAFAIEQDVDWIALSFVRGPAEIRRLKKMIADAQAKIKVIAKIEKPEALKNIDEIIEESDGIMIARGDLGIEIPMEEVPMSQKLIIQKCNQAAKPVIVATQMMESMIENPRPTRAETTDVANAAMDGADALMLSGETSIGKYPVEVVKSMQKIITSVEEQPYIYNKNTDSDPNSRTFLHDSVIGSSCFLARKTRASAIVGMTASGYTAFQIAKNRPKAHIFIFTHDPKMLNILNLVWGVRTFVYDKYEGTDETFHDLKEFLKEKKLVFKDDILINTASMPIGARNRTNMVKISVVD